MSLSIVKVNTRCATLYRLTSFKAHWPWQELTLVTGKPALAALLMGSTGQPASKSAIGMCAALRQVLVLMTNASAQQHHRGTSGAVRTVAKNRGLPDARMHAWLPPARVAGYDLRRLTRTQLSHAPRPDRPVSRAADQAALHARSAGRQTPPAGVLRAQNKDSCGALGL